MHAKDGQMHTCIHMHTYKDTKVKHERKQNKHLGQHHQNYFVHFPHFSLHRGTEFCLSHRRQMYEQMGCALSYRRQMYKRGEGCLMMSCISTGQGASHVTRAY